MVVGGLEVSAKRLVFKPTTVKSISSHKTDDGRERSFGDSVEEEGVEVGEFIKGLMNDLCLDLVMFKARGEAS